MQNLMLRLLLCGWTAAQPFALIAQGASLSGRVVDAATGAPVSNVLISAGAVRAMTTSEGQFALAAAPGTVVFARLGFAPESLQIIAAPTAFLTVRLRATALRLTPTLVRADAAMSAASSGTIRAFDLQVRPRATAQELLRLVPGLVIAQHAGGGKAEQIFLRGFDADHGTDVAITADGMPVNMVSHGHGQGYADLHFLIPEVVDRLDVRKGPYDVRDGDLGVAGSVGFTTRDRVERAAMLGAGSFGQRSGTVLAPFGGDASRAGGYVAAQLMHADGPFELPQGLRRVNGFAKYTAPVRGARLALSAAAFDSRWDASGQVPERAIARGLISRFGAIDSTEGGNTSRASLQASLSGGTPLSTAWEARAYLSSYDFRLFSNFTFFADDTANGDGIEQLDRRVLGGGEVTMERFRPLAGIAGTWRGAVGVRADDAEVGLFGARGRQRGATRSLDRVLVANPWLRAERTSQLGARVRATVGVRADAFRFGSRDLTSTGSALTRWDAVVSPEVSVAVDAGRGTTFFVNAGRGFHSNDARAVVRRTAGDRTLPVADGAEVGVRHATRQGSVAVAAWGLDLQSELVWSGDAGMTEAGGRTRRTGVDVEGRLSLGPVTADADVSLSRGRLRDEAPGANRIPLAPTLTSTGGLTATPRGWVSSVRWRQVGSRAATEDNTVRAAGYLLLDLASQRRVAGVTIRAAIDNLLNRRWNEAQFATTSRLRGEPEPVTELHLTPGAPRTVTLTVTRAF